MSDTRNSKNLDQHVKDERKSDVAKTESSKFPEQSELSKHLVKLKAQKLGNDK